MNKEKLKEAACHAIEREKARIIGWAEEIAAQPELGFKEIKTSELIRSVFESLGLPTGERLRGLKKANHRPRCSLGLILIRREL